MNLYNLFCLLTTLCSTRLTVSTSPDTIVFPEDETPQQGISISLAMALSNVTSIDELFDNFVDERTRPPHLLMARFGGPVERKALKTAKMATCMPEQTTVSLKPASADVATFYYPPCTRVARCGGCCSHDLLSCQPVEVEILQLGVVVTEYKGGNQLAYRGRDVVSIEQHKSCKCDCKVKATDCQPYQKYSKETCRCVCANFDKQEKCNEEAPLKLWSPNECDCVCREVLNCSSGSYFDRYSCRCVQERTRKNNTYGWDSYGYSVR